MKKRISENEFKINFNSLCNQIMILLEFKIYVINIYYVHFNTNKIKIKFLK